MDDQTSGQAPRTVAQALGRLRVALDDAYTQTSRELGVTAQQAELLCAAMRPAAVGDLAEVLRCDRSNVSRLVDRAARRGLIHRRATEADGRVTLVELSPEGERLAGRFIEALESRLAPLLADWSATRQRAATQSLNALADALDGSRQPRPPTLRRGASAAGIDTAQPPTPRSRPAAIQADANPRRRQ